MGSGGTAPSLPSAYSANSLARAQLRHHEADEGSDVPDGRNAPADVEKLDQQIQRVQIANLGRRPIGHRHEHFVATVGLPDEESA